jgi:hypothetical protein
MAPRLVGVARAGLAGLALIMAAGEATAHGGLSMEKDDCKLRIGPYLMHFTGYQPQADYSKEFCEDIPSTGFTIIVLDFVDDPLRDLATEVRIVKDGADEADLERATVFRLPPRKYSTGSLSFDYTFADAGNYVGLVTVVDGDQKMLARFPFSVGSSKWLRNVVAALVFVIGIAGAYAFWAGRRAANARA